MDVVITGHRPKKLPKIAQLDGAFREAFSRFKVRRIIQGMADGADLIAARTAYRMDIPFVAVRPGNWHKPGLGWQRDYDNALKYAELVKIVDEVSDSYPGPWALHKRNEYMVDMIDAKHEDIVIAVWDGSPSGTRNCVEYAIKHNLRIWRIDPNTLQGEWLK